MSFNSLSSEGFMGLCIAFPGETTTATRDFGENYILKRNCCAVGMWFKKNASHFTSSPNVMLSA